ncbi:thiamine diphosphate-binding protein [Scenedesmus sp. NREL 46B-D3]|nr:thiamine diphosphate-binding protein [Scenedesmus sp. NREL 46B-D3]
MDVEDTLKLAAHIRRFRSRGHLVAQLDPLQRTAGGPWLGPIGDGYTRSDHTLMRLVTNYPWQSPPQQRCAYLARELGLAGPADPCRLYAVGQVMPGSPDGAPAKPLWQLHEAVEVMTAAYCGSLAIEYKHLQQQDEMTWVEQRFESRRRLSNSEKRQARAMEQRSVTLVAVLRWLLAAHGFEQFLSRKFPASKRFGLEGCEALLPGLLALVEAGTEQGLKRVEVAAAHRGRLSLLANLLGKPLGALCSEMEGKQSDFRVGDVKYHLGQTGVVRVGPELRQVTVSIAPNPSHLEFVGPVVLGMVRAEQASLLRSGAVGSREAAWARVLPLHIHGDAAFAGLGVVVESLQLADLPGFSVGGSVHVIINNQVGFTTMPRHGRSSPHPSDVLKVIGAPILHANADDPEAVVEAMQLAADWRARWHKDIVVDIVGYRRNGHNELDDPRVTLPLSYQLIEQHPTVLDIYARQLQAEGVVSGDELSRWRSSWAEAAEAQWEAAGQGAYKESAAEFLVSSWQGDALMSAPGAVEGDPTQEPTGLPLTTLQRVGNAICKAPEGFNCHPDVVALLAARREMVSGADSRVDWAMAEALAVGTLLLHRDRTPDTPHPFLDDPASAPLGWGLNTGHYNVRLTGQDCERGTFGQRHAVLWDQQTAERLVLLNSIKPGHQDEVEVWNSPLNEAGVLGFEYGYSLGARNRALVMWEAQFGDFSNSAQVIIDQFIASGEEKWGQTSGLVLLLPHGYDGQGPDHSSARIERWLQLAQDDPDTLPGHSPGHRQIMSTTFEAISKETGGKMYKTQVLDLLTSLGLGKRQHKANGHGSSANSSASTAASISADAAAAADDAELAELLWEEMGVPEGRALTRSGWERFMLQYVRRHAERDANVCIVNATTPAQYFHLLRRQVNLPHKKPLVLFTPKYLLHHRPCSSALRDFTIGTFFNRVIDDGKASDNTRHMAVNPATGQPHLLPAEAIRRVVLCTGQVYYQLSRARRARRLRDVVLVRLEQISPFPHDLLMNVVQQYKHAQLVWVQEEPKNMGAQCSQSSETGSSSGEDECSSAVGVGEVDWASKRVHYVGRAAAASPATASFSIHLKEMQDVINAALSSNAELEG